MEKKHNCESILVVEDDPAIRNSLVELLEAEGYKIFSAGNGKEALEMLKTLPTPCLILLDLMMPVMNGWEFSRFKQGDYRIAPIPVVVVSALSSDEGIAGVVGHIKKPINLDTLLKVVGEYCGSTV